MKKLISVILCLAMLVSTLAVSSTASEAKEIQWDGDPVIFLQGFTGSPLIKDQGLETEETILGAGSEFDITKTF